MSWLIAAAGRHARLLAALAIAVVVLLDLLDLLPDVLVEWLLAQLRPYVSSSSHPQQTQLLDQAMALLFLLPSLHLRRRNSDAVRGW